MAAANIQFALIFCIIALGYIAKRIKLLKESDSDAISRFVFNITLPALAFSRLSTVDINANILIIMATAFLFGVLMQLVNFPFIKGKDNQYKGLMALHISGFSVGLFAYPIAEALWGAPGVVFIGMFDMGNVFITFGLNYLMAGTYSSMQKASVGSAVRSLFKSPPFLAYITALLLALFKVPVPSFFIDFTTAISKANMPAALILLGVTLSFIFTKQEIRDMGKILLLRYSFGLAIGLSIYFLTPWDPLLKSVALLGLLCPIAVSSIIMAAQFGYDKKFSSAINNASILISFVLLWSIFGFILV